MARRIVHLLEEEENQSKILRTKYMNVEVERTQEYWRYLYVQESREPTPEREEVLPLNPMKDPPQCEVIMPRRDKNDNGKRKPVIQIPGKKARKLNKKREKLEKNARSSREDFVEGRFQELELCQNINTAQIRTLP
jgi:hypothetical protein